MTKRAFIYILLVILTGRGVAVAQSRPLSLWDAIVAAESGNRSIAVAESAVDVAKAERGMVESVWYPTVMLAGEYSHTTSEIGLSSTLGQMTEGLAGNLEAIFADIPAIGAILESVGSAEVGLDLVPRNTASLGLEMVWPVMTGGKRIGASRIGKQMVALAEQGAVQTESKVRCEVIGAYFGLSLAEQVVALRGQRLDALRRHAHQAQRLCQEGMITPSESLVARVAVEQATTALRQAQSDRNIALRILCTAMGEELAELCPTTPLFMPDSLPSEEFFVAALEDNSTLRSLDIQRSIATNQLKIEQGSYLPQVALIASQRLWDEGLNDQLFPRTFVGVGVSWTLFDGLGREKRVARSRATLRTTNATRTEVESQLSIAIERLYQNIQTAISEFAALTTTEQLAEDLVRTRRKAFAEGVATSTEVVDAEVVLSEARLGKAATLYAIDTSLATLLMLCGQDDEYTNYINNQAYEEQ